MRLIQFETSQGQRHVGVIEGDQIHVVIATQTTRELALDAIRKGHGLVAEVLARGTEASPFSYSQTLEEGRVLPPLDHADPAHCLISGTGLTHLGSASTRDKMHQQNTADESAMTDTARIFSGALKVAARHPARWACNLNGSTRAMVRLWSAPVARSTNLRSPKMRAKSPS